MEAVSLNLTERRVAWDGEAYTFTEYAEFYGFQRALTFWQTNSAEQPVDTIVGHPGSHAEQPGDINSAAQPVDITGISNLTGQYSQPSVAGHALPKLSAMGSHECEYCGRMVHQEGLRQHQAYNRRCVERRGEIWIPKDSYKDEAILAQMPRLAEIRPNPAIVSRVWLKPVVRIKNRPKKYPETHDESLDEDDSSLSSTGDEIPTYSHSA